MLKINLADPRVSRAEYERLSRALVDDLEQKLEDAREDRGNLLEAASGLVARVRSVYRGEYAERVALAEPESLLGWCKRLETAITQAKARQ